MNTDIAILMGSDSDFDQVKAALPVLEELGIGYKVRVLSAHRTPKELHDFVENCPAKVFIAAAGGAAHLAGVIASMTTLPVLGIPIGGTSLSGLDSLLSTVQMPGGIPVATFAVGKAGAKNAAIFAAQILAASDEALAEKLRAQRTEMAKKVLQKDQALQDKIQNG
ncbi:MAG: 5-(carboxyamino)imidazole ribonucleotide mutase [Planctomycetota bacterium]|nr:5-(carboxyamino)imidazole ribonucleotide mutase [Planctomycetota bacterium]